MLQSFLSNPTDSDQGRLEMTGNVKTNSLSGSEDSTVEVLEFKKPSWIDDESSDYEKYWIKRDDLNAYCDSQTES